MTKTVELRQTAFQTDPLAEIPLVDPYGVDILLKDINGSTVLGPVKDLGMANLTTKLEDISIESPVETAGLLTKLMGNVDDAIAFVSDVGAAGVKIVTGFLCAILDALGNLVNGAMGLMNIVSELIQGALGMFDNILGMLSDLLSSGDGMLGFLNDLKCNGVSILDTALNLVDTISTAGAKFIDDIIAKGVDVFDTVMGIVDIAAGLIAGIVDFFTGNNPADLDKVLSLGTLPPVATIAPILAGLNGLSADERDKLNAITGDLGVDNIKAMLAAENAMGKDKLANAINRYLDNKSLVKPAQVTDSPSDIIAHPALSDLISAAGNLNEQDLLALAKLLISNPNLRKYMEDTANISPANIATFIAVLDKFSAAIVDKVINGINAVGVEPYVNLSTGLSDIWDTSLMTNLPNVLKIAPLLDQLNTNILSQDELQILATKELAKNLKLLEQIDKTNNDVLMLQGNVIADNIKAKDDMNAVISALTAANATLATLTDLLPSVTSKAIVGLIPDKINTVLAILESNNIKLADSVNLALVSMLDTVNALDIISAATVDYNALVVELTAKIDIVSADLLDNLVKLNSHLDVLTAIESYLTTQTTPTNIADMITHVLGMIATIDASVYSLLNVPSIAALIAANDNLHSLELKINSGEILPNDGSVLAVMLINKIDVAIQELNYILLLNTSVADTVTATDLSLVKLGTDVTSTNILLERTVASTLTEKDGTYIAEIIVGIIMDLTRLRYNVILETLAITSTSLVPSIDTANSSITDIWVSLNKADNNLYVPDGVNGLYNQGNLANTIANVNSTMSDVSSGTAAIDPIKSANKVALVKLAKDAAVISKMKETDKLALRSKVDMIPLGVYGKDVLSVAVPVMARRLAAAGKLGSLASLIKDYSSIFDIQFRVKLLTDCLKHFVSNTQISYTVFVDTMLSIVPSLLDLTKSYIDEIRHLVWRDASDDAKILMRLDGRTVLYIEVVDNVLG